ncbi:MAG: enoyl-CoA hydratase/isomerase family protein [Azospirillaceae bacterium]
MSADIQVEQRGSVAAITINRPARRNALDGPAWMALRDGVRSVSDRSGTRVIILAGAEGNFCAGDDLKDSELKLGGEAAIRYARLIEETYSAILSAPQPVIAAISGACLGAGASIALHCDFRLADPTAKIGIPASKIGDYYPPHLCRRLALTAGVATARRMLMTGDPVGGEAARACGLVDDLSTDAPAAAADFARTLATRAPLSTQAVKRVMESVLNASYERDLGELDRLMDLVRNSRDREEGRIAFLEKRSPEFRGV